MTEGPTVGIVGGGQLARMLCLAAAPLGLRTHVFAPEPDAPAFDVCARRTVGPYDDPVALEAFARMVDVVTFEFENVSVATLANLPVDVRPPLRALAVSQDRLTEKAFLSDCGLSVAPHAAVDDLASLRTALDRLGCPAILKTRRLGYDGKGQARIATPDDARPAWDAMANAPAILEAEVPFVAEASTILVRGTDGALASYEPPGNTHAGGILRRSEVPGPLDAATHRHAHAMAARVAERLDYVGVLAIEWFVTGDSDAPLIANEIAPRVHNSGHWTMDGAATSQFENHMRAVAGLPLGPTDRLRAVRMVNLIGEEVDGWRAHLGDPSARLHLYGKNETRPGRKMGHVNFVAAGMDFGRRD